MKGKFKKMIHAFREILYYSRGVQEGICSEIQAREINILVIL